MRTALALAQRALDAMEPYESPLEEVAEHCDDLSCLWMQAGAAYRRNDKATGDRLRDQALDQAHLFGDDE